MKRYIKGRIHTITLGHGTEKAFYVDVDDGRWGAERNTHLWIPRSVCIIDAPNENGWSEISIPLWVFSRARIDVNRVGDIIEKRVVVQDA